jgi:membrane protein
MKKIINFFKKEIWKEHRGAGAFTQFFYSSLKILILTVQGFLANKEFEKASTLTFYTLLSIIPLAAIGFGIAQTFGFEEKFAEQVREQLSSQPQIAEKIIQFALSTLKQTKGGIIAGLGILTLLWTVLQMIGYIEEYFDVIWKTKKTRTLWQQVKNFIPMIMIFPIFLVASSSALLYGSTKAILTAQSIEYLSFFTVWLELLFNLLQYLVSWALLSFIYIYLPNTKVYLKSGILGAIVAGILFYIWQWVYLTFQVKASSYGAIYGSFAAIPLFLIWLNYSWTIVLFGSQLSYQIQNEKK